MKILSPKLDYVIKELFHNEIILKYFISDILGIPIEHIQSVRLLNPFLRKRLSRLKQGILDILLELNDRTKINIELQIKRIKHWDKRQLFYLAKLYVSDLLAGWNYERLKRCVGISILDFNLIEDEEYHHIFQLQDKQGRIFSEDLEIHTLELRKHLKGTSPVNDWIRLFNAESTEDLDMIKTNNNGILEAIQELKHMSLPGIARAYWEDYLKARRDTKAREDYVWDEGKEVGISIERQEEKQRLNTLYQHLKADNRTEDIMRAIDDPDYQQQLLQEYDL